MQLKKSADISRCGNYRYELRRIWDESKPLVMFIGLNPSTADAEADDNTSRVCINYAQRWGYGGLLLGNLFGFRSKDQSGLFRAKDPIGPESDGSLARLQAQAALVVCAWGASGRYLSRDGVVLAKLHNPQCLVRLKCGAPGHPLYKKSSLQPVRYER